MDLKQKDMTHAQLRKNDRGVTYYGYPGLELKPTGTVVKEILRIVQSEYQVTLAQITAKGRQKNVTEARHIAMYLIRRKTAMSLLDVGLFFGSRDHTTVIHACNKIKDLVGVYPEFADKVNNMLECI